MLGLFIINTGCPELWVEFEAAILGVSRPSAVVTKERFFQGTVSFPSSACASASSCRGFGTDRDIRYGDGMLEILCQRLGVK